MLLIHSAGCRGLAVSLQTLCVASSSWALITDVVMAFWLPALRSARRHTCNGFWMQELRGLSQLQPSPDPVVSLVMQPRYFAAEPAVEEELQEEPCFSGRRVPLPPPPPFPHTHRGPSSIALATPLFPHLQRVLWKSALARWSEAGKLPSHQTATRVALCISWTAGFQNQPESHKAAAPQCQTSFLSNCA